MKTVIQTANETIFEWNTQKQRQPLTGIYVACAHEDMFFGFNTARTVFELTT